MQDQASDLGRIVAVVYGLVLGQSLYQVGKGGGTHFLLNPGAKETETASAALALVFLVTFWNLLGYTLNLRRFPYWVKWEQGTKNATGLEELRFAADLAVAIGYSQMLVAATTSITSPRRSLTPLLALFVAVEALNWISETLRHSSWEVPARRLQFLLGPVLLGVYEWLWHMGATGSARQTLNTEFLWLSVLSVMIRGLWLRGVYRRAMT